MITHTDTANSGLKKRCMYIEGIKHIVLTFTLPDHLICHDSVFLKDPNPQRMCEGTRTLRLGDRILEQCVCVQKTSIDLLLLPASDRSGLETDIRPGKDLVAVMEKLYTNYYEGASKKMSSWFALPKHINDSPILLSSARN